jgi:NAD(P)-dependent dehydrogenase (short-subunit alcohol dehydrogenase family)
MSVAGKVVFITGAARGIGAEAARVLAARGSKLALAGLEPERLAAVAGELGAEHVWFECDVTEQAALELAVAGTLQRYGRIDVVIANAGVAAIGTVATTPPEALARVLEVNLIGVVRTVAATLPHITASRGYYSLISSAAAFAAMPGLAAYCASKSGVEHFANALRYELEPKGVGVGTIHPCWIDTDLVRSARSDLPTFDHMLPRLPWPFGTVSSVRSCADAIVGAIERRKRRSYVPRILAPFAALRYLLVNPPLDLVVRWQAKSSMPTLEKEATSLGRSFGAHSAELTRPIRR